MKTSATVLKVLGSVVLGFSLFACGSGTVSDTGSSATTTASSGSDSTTTDSNSTANATVSAAVSAVFGGSGQSASLSRSTIGSRVAALFIAEAKASTYGGPTSACEIYQAVSQGITMTTSVTAGSYGLASNGVTVTADDGCAAGGEYIQFTVNSHELSCEDGNGNTETIVMDNSTGVWRINPDNHMTEIYGAFNMTVGTATVSNILCTFTIDNTQGPDGLMTGDCEDASGNPVSQAAGATCENS